MQNYYCVKECLKISGRKPQISWKIWLENIFFNVKEIVLGTLSDFLQSRSWETAGTGAELVCVHLCVCMYTCVCVYICVCVCVHIYIYIYIPQLLYPFICWRASKLLSCPVDATVFSKGKFDFLSRDNGSQSSLSACSLKMPV